MLSLNPNQARVLGVMIEKATTTPELYPLSLNALTNGCNQKNNRDPVRSMTEDEVFDAVESLRATGMAVRVDQFGSRVAKYRHEAKELLQVRAGELAILAELLLRGPQTIGELRTRASRMAPMDSLELAQSLVDTLIGRDEPLVRQIPPAPGSRAVRYQQLLCPEPAIPMTASTVAPDRSTPPPYPSAATERLDRLEAEVAALRDELARLRRSLGEPEGPT